MEFAEKELTVHRVVFLSGFRSFSKHAFTMSPNELTESLNNYLGRNG